MASFDPIKLSQDLIRCPSVTPKDAGALDVLQQFLEANGFECTRLPFSDEDTPDVDNLFARKGNSGPHFCYAGHTDVVPAGDLEEWIHPPFDAVIEDGFLYGRGASDMKCGIAAFAVAAAEMDGFEGSISLLITGDEEGPAINGTIKMLKWLKDNDQVPDVCIVGEPTNTKQIGDMAKIGRRGSLNGHIIVEGVQGHVAYQKLADNPIPRLVNTLDALNNWEIDNGNDFFDPSNLEIVTVDVGNAASNVIPMLAEAKFNIRFNNEHSVNTLIDHIWSICDQHAQKFELDINVSGEAFLTEKGELSELVTSSIKEITGLNVELSTTGGTSDARFIKDYCPVIEFGLINKTIHKVNECARVDDINTLRDVYRSMLKRYFNQ